jgi:hypothetical protein
MTQQIRDKIKYEGEDYCHINFIFPYNDKKVKFPYKSFVAPHTALRKGFHVSAEVIDSKLIITEFFGFINDKLGSRISIGISNVFKEEKLPLFADWFSGKIKCFLGGDLVSCEEILILHFDKGLLNKTSSINRRVYFRSISIGSILDKEINKVKLAFEHSKGCFREIRMRGDIFWIESFNDNNEIYQIYNEISRDDESVTMSLKKYESNDDAEYLVKTLIKEGKMQYSRDNGNFWSDLYEVEIIINPLKTTRNYR